MSGSVPADAQLAGLRHLARGKVRDLYEVDADHLLFVASDRLSAFDVVMANGIPGKGRILTQISLFWFELLRDVCPNHLVTADVDAMPAAVRAHADHLRGRSMLVRKLRILPVEAIVRGYLAGSGLKEYRAQGTVCGIPLPPGLEDGSRLPHPLYTPSTKAALGAHDENIHPDQAARILGAHADRVRELTLAVYQRAAAHAAARGIIIADTKLEFGVDAVGRVVLADEVLTPDSSRFWPAATWQPGRTQASFDKQFVRDWLEQARFDKNGPGITLPDAVVQGTLARYVEAFRLLTGREPQL